MQHQNAKRRRLGRVEVEARHLDRPGGQLHDARSGGTRIVGRIARNGRRSPLGFEQGGTVGAAHQDGEQTFLGGYLGEIGAHPPLVALRLDRDAVLEHKADVGLVALLHEIRDGLLHRVHHQLRAQLHVRTKPLGQQPFDVRQAEVGDDARCERHRKHEAQHD